MILFEMVALDDNSVNNLEQVTPLGHREILKRIIHFTQLLINHDFQPMRFGFILFKLFEF